MLLVDVRFLFGYDQWATLRLLDAWDRHQATSPATGRVIGERDLTAIMVHMLGAAQRWRAYIAGQPRPPRREEAPDPASPADLRREWDEEWRLRSTVLASLDDAALERTPDEEDPLGGVPLWQTMVHLVNHGTQHRSEAAAILTDAGSSPGDLDVLDYAREVRVR